MSFVFFFFFSSRRRHTRCSRDWSSDVCSSDLIRWSAAHQLDRSRQPAVRPERRRQRQHRRLRARRERRDRKSTRLNSSHGYISYAVFCLKKKKTKHKKRDTEEQTHM